MRKRLLAICALCTLNPFSYAYGSQASSPAVEARLIVSNPTPYIKETFSLTLEIVSRDIEISSRLDLTNLPDRDILPILGSFEALSVQRERENNHEITRRRYRANARALQPTKIALAPVLRLTSRERVRSFFGSTVQERPISLQVPEVIIKPQQLPSPPDTFTGIIGDISIDVKVAPLDIRVGDLVSIETKLEGEGWIPENAIPIVEATGFLRAYRLRQISSERSDRKRFRQIVVPMDKSVQEIPALPFTWFNPTIGDYETDTLGPFALQYKAEESDPAAETEHVLENQDLTHRRGLLRNRIEVKSATQAYLAPAQTSKSTFTIPPGTNVRILQTYDDWLLIDYDNHRGWIPSNAFSP